MLHSTICEPARETPVIWEGDVCVLGGSCTGVFAAIRAARLGCSVALVERMGCFGGVATLSLVNAWHSAMDEAFEKQIIGGLSLELIERLKKRNAVEEFHQNPNRAWNFNSQEMQMELDEMVLEHRIRPWLHTAFVAPHVENGELAAVIVENKDGRGAIRARFFIDATGDGDLCHRLGLPVYVSSRNQPSTTCAIFDGWNSLGDFNLYNALREYGHKYGLPEGFAWGQKVPNSELYMLAGTRIYQNCSSADGFTSAEMEGRRQVRAIQNIIREHGPADARITLQTLPARIGIRETRHVRCGYQLTGEDVLHGRRFDDAIANGSYRVDIHHHDKPGITLRYLDGREVYCRPGYRSEEGRWRQITDDNPTFYQIPYRSMIPQGNFGNLLAAGRFIDADEVAHAGIRVMINMNQTGEAAGTAAALALRESKTAVEIEPEKLRRTLADGGSVIL